MVLLLIVDVSAQRIQIGRSDAITWGVAPGWCETRRWRSVPSNLKIGANLFVAFAQDFHVDFFVDDQGVRRHTVHEKDIGADGRPEANGGFATNNRYAGI